jgi:hypothetical protein
MSRRSRTEPVVIGHVGKSGVTVSAGVGLG